MGAAINYCIIIRYKEQQVGVLERMFLHRFKYITTGRGSSACDIVHSS